MTTRCEEPSELDMAMHERHYVVGFAAIGPLTEEQTKREYSYNEYQEESQREHDAYVAAGCRSVCPSCGNRSVKTRSVCTLGYAGHPGAEFSALEECENCDYKDLA